MNIFMKTFSRDPCLKKWGLCVLKGHFKKALKPPVQVIDLSSVFDVWGA